MILDWAPNPVAFHFGTTVVRYYSLLFMFGFFISYFGFEFSLKKFTQHKFNTDLFCLVALGVVLVGTRLFHLVFYETDRFFSDPMVFFKFADGGLASHGALVGLVIYVWAFCRWKNISFWELGDIIAIWVGYSAACVRFGNFMNSEILGRPTSGTWGVVFGLIDHIPRHPVQLYEAFSYIALSTLMLISAMNGKLIKWRGRSSGILFAGMFTIRFVMEFFKEEQAVDFQSVLTMGQWLSIIPIGVGLFLVLRKKIER